MNNEKVDYKLLMIKTLNIAQRSCVWAVLPVILFGTVFAGPAMGLCDSINAVINTKDKSKRVRVGIDTAADTICKIAKAPFDFVVETYKYGTEKVEKYKSQKQKFELTKKNIVRTKQRSARQR